MRTNSNWDFLLDCKLFPEIRNSLFISSVPEPPIRESNTTQGSKEELGQNDQQMDILEAQGDTKTDCKVCKNSFKSILKHLSQQPDCMALNSESEISALKKWSEQVSTLKQKVWREKNKEKKSLKNQAYHQVHKKAISKSKAEYYQKNKDAIAIKADKKKTENKERKAKENREETQRVIENQIKWRDDYELIPNEKSIA